MRTVKHFFIALFVLFVGMPALADLPPAGHPDAPDDPRYCGEPKRDESGKIIRDHDMLRKFMKVFPCPSDFSAEYGQCKGWALDHTIPLKNGGCDSQINLTWLPDVLKSCAGHCKDRWERKYHAYPRQQIDIEAMFERGIRKQIERMKEADEESDE